MTATDGDEPRAHTVDEMRELFVAHLKSTARYWARVKLGPEFEAQIADGGETLYRLEGFLHSICVLFDGGAGGMPAFDITPSPHESDEQHHRDNGDNWWTKAVINDCQLHDMLYPRAR